MWSQHPMKFNSSMPLCLDRNLTESTCLASVCATNFGSQCFFLVEWGYFMTSERVKVMIYACNIDREINNMDRMGTNISFRYDALWPNMFRDISIWRLGIYSNLTLCNQNLGFNLCAFYHCIVLHNITR